MERLAAWFTAVVLIGVGLSFLGVQLPFLMWVDHWGDETGRAIRVVLVTITVALFAISARQLQPRTV